MVAAAQPTPESGLISDGNPGNSAVVITGIEKLGLGVHEPGHDFSSHLLPGFIAHNCDALGHAVMLANQGKVITQCCRTGALLRHHPLFEYVSTLMIRSTSVWHRPVH